MFLPPNTPVPTRRQLGAYFGSQTIQEGAAGLGNLERVTAFADGVVGGAPLDAEMPGRVVAYRDGSLGDAPLQAFADGIVGGAPLDAERPGRLLAFRDGSLGEAPESDELSVFQDGVLGPRFIPNGYPGAPLAYHDGSLGAYLGAIGAAEGNVLDLGNPGVLKEVKSAMALLAPELALTAEGQKQFPASFYVSEIWEPEASLLWQAVAQKGPQGKPLSNSSGAQSWPNELGLGWMAATIGAPQGAFGPAYLMQNMPAMGAWLAAGGGQVAPPYLSLSDKVKGKPGGGGTMKMTTVAWMGLGAAGLVALALFTRKKR